MGREREKEWLEEIRRLDRLIISRTADAELWRARAESFGVPPEGDRVQTSATQDSMRMADIYIDIEADICELYEERERRIRLIKSMPSPYCDVLYRRYVLGDMFKTISADWGKAEGWSTTVHGRALDLLKIKLDEMERYEENHGTTN